MSLSTDGIWKAGVWATTVWADDVWYESGGAPAPSPSPTPAGVSHRKDKKHRDKRKRLFVSVDGQDFEVSSEAQALEVLRRARALAEKHAEQQVEAAPASAPEAPYQRISAPQIEVSPEIRDEAAPVLEDIKRLYTKAQELAELRALLQKQMRDEDDEDDFMLLM